MQGVGVTFFSGKIGGHAVLVDDHQISPGSISRMNFASIRSRAQLSEATT